MNINYECLNCTIRKMDTLFDKYSKDKKRKLMFMKEIYKIASQVEVSDTAPLLSSKMLKALSEELETKDIFLEEKRRYNSIILEKAQYIEEIIKKSDHALLTALKFAMVGNLIDFGAMDEVDNQLLDDVIEKAPQQKIDLSMVRELIADLEVASKLVYLTDNSGEIVLDKLFLKELTEVFPKLSITAIVRGKPVLNDATLEDAKQIDLGQVVGVIGNGTAIPGTQLGLIGEDASSAIQEADVIIAKGQGNFESLAGCGLNVYYLFLCKCNLFTERFDLEKYSGVITREKTIKNLL